MLHLAVKVIAGFSQPCGIEFCPEFVRASRKHISYLEKRESGLLALEWLRFCLQTNFSSVEVFDWPKNVHSALNVPQEGAL